MVSYRLGKSPTAEKEDRQEEPEEQRERRREGVVLVGLCPSPQGWTVLLQQEDISEFKLRDVRKVKEPIINNRGQLFLLNYWVCSLIIRCEVSVFEPGSC